MNYKNPEKLKNVKKVVKNLAVFCALILGFAAIFFSPNTTSQTITTDCSTISGTAEPGKNCLHFGMKLCTAVPSPSYEIPTSSILTATPEHRVNCADLSDLPLCSQVTPPPSPIKNCVNECSSITTGTGVRGTDYAVHNRDCIRFCDAPEAGLTAATAAKCVGRKCHQLANGVSPTTSNCNLLTCNLLAPDELDEVKFDDATKKYCEGTNIKCFEFTQSQLPFVKYRTQNSMCQIHNCRASSTTCISYATDDVQKILDKGSTYAEKYKLNINANQDVTPTDTTLCKVQTQCKSVERRYYRCLPLDQTTPPPTTKDANKCDVTDVNGAAVGNGSICSSGQCFKTIDCNLGANSKEPECIPKNINQTNYSSGTIDDGNLQSWFYRPAPLPNDGNKRSQYHHNTKLCYTKGNMIDLNDEDKPYSHSEHWGYELAGGSYYMNYLDYSTKSPGICNDGGDGSTRQYPPSNAYNNSGAGNDGNPGAGILYMCLTTPENGAHSLLKDYAAYHVGYASTTYNEAGGEHKVKVCVRFNNTLIPNGTCGARECGITCTAGIGCTEACGQDWCETLTINDDSAGCPMDENFFNGSPDRPCAKRLGADGTLDGYIRLRAAKYDNRICTFIDLLGPFAYNPIYQNGTEKLADGTCLSGGGKDSCIGKNTNDLPGLADRWRTVQRIPYIQDYTDVSGRIFAAQECMKVPLRVAPPAFFNLATIQRSPELFIPPLYLLNSRVKRGGSISPGANGDFGRTDFHYPELEVKFGATTQKLSLGIGSTGHETTSPDPQGSATITAIVNGRTYSEQVFVRKEFNQNISTPTFCLYRKIKDETGADLEPKQLECVKRTFPEINNRDSRNLIQPANNRRLELKADPTNSYSLSKIILKYLDDSAFTSTVTLDNIDSNVPTCSSDVEKHQVCAQRDGCSQLNIECVQNEIALHDAKIAGQPFDSFLTVRKTCNEILLPNCNRRKGYSASSSATITNQTPVGETPEANVYGWFNEICISSGFESKLRTIVAYKPEGGVLGKCLIDPRSPYLTDGNNSTNCDVGGKAPGCLCLEAVSGVDGGEIERFETPHEAGLCVDMPLAQLCPTIDYNTSPNTLDPTDPEYVSSSLNKTTYNNTTGVNLSHQTRAAGTASGYAEFLFGIFGMNNVEGECKGFWTSATSPTTGTSLTPMRDCKDIATTTNGITTHSAQWGTVSNACVRYSCPEITTAGFDTITNSYQGGYGASEEGGAKGLVHGFALWPKFTKTNDFLENAPVAINQIPKVPTAANSYFSSACLPGFKQTGATAVNPGYSSSATAALYAGITHYTGGTTPTRQCNQLGQWQSPTNICVRITCPAIDPTIPTSSSDTVNWNLWKNSGGATFPSANASRSSSGIEAGSIASGTCADGLNGHKNLGFFQAPGAPAPTRECDHLGNWLPVKNPCVTQCEAISVLAEASSAVNGFSYWSKLSGLGIDETGTTTSTSCTSGYIPYPYPSRNDAAGAPYTLGTSLNLGANTIPKVYTAAADNRTLERTRSCKFITVSGAVGAYAHIWTAPSSSCIKECPGGDVDDRINIGKTEHNFAQTGVSTSSVWFTINNGTASQGAAAPVSGGKITISWPSAPFGSTVYAENLALTNSQVDSGDYTSATRVNGSFSLARTCGSDGKWGAVTMQCVSGGEIGTSNATYGAKTRIAVGVNAASGSCKTGYSQKTVTDTACTIEYDTATSTLIPGSGTCGNDPYRDCACPPGSDESCYPTACHKDVVTYASTTAPTYACTADASNNIDKTYLNKTSGAACVPVCTVTSGQDFGSGSEYVGTGKTVEVNEVVTLACKSGNGYRIDGASKTVPAAGNCGRTPNDRIATPPTVTCTGANTWSGVSNDCAACRGCDFGDASHPNNIRYGPSAVAPGIDLVNECYYNTVTHYHRFNPASGTVLSGCGDLLHGQSSTCTSQITLETCDDFTTDYTVQSKASTTLHCTDGKASASTAQWISDNYRR